VGAPIQGQIALVHAYVYINAVKRRELERRLRELGWTLLRHGGKHDVWISAHGEVAEYVPRHPEINERLAQAILKSAKERR
jgi:mRNA interferase HicA